MAVLEVSSELDRGEGTFTASIWYFYPYNHRTNPSYSAHLSSHCITGSGFPSQLEEGEEDDSLSPEACYECKINGGGKKGRRKRNADENELNQVHEQTNAC